MSSPRIAIVTHNVVKGDGQGRANYEIARYAHANGVSVHLYSDNVSPDLIAAGINFTPIPLNSTLRRINLFKVYEFAKKADLILNKKANDFDIVHNYGYCTGVKHQINTSQFVHSAWMKSKFHPSKQGKSLNAAYQWCYTFFNSVWERKAYLQADHVVAASHTVKAELQDLGVSTDRLSVILNGADLTEFYPGKEDRQALGLPQGVTLGLFAGDIRSNRKNLDSVLKALVESPQTHLAVVGRVEGSPFPALAEKLGVASRVHFLDFRRDIAKIMRAVDFFVFPSRYEACSLVLAEAIASGLPVITAVTTGGSELVRDGSGVLLQDANDVMALRDAILKLTTDLPYREQMAAAARRIAPSCSWDSVVAQYFDLYTGFVK